MKQTSGRTVFIFVVVLCFTALSVFADAGDPLLFMGNHSLFDQKYYSGRGNVPASQQIQSLNIRPKVNGGRMAFEILAGIGGNISLAFAGGFLGSFIRSDDHEGFISPGTGLGGMAGSIMGSALGVYLAGNSGNVRGRFGSALMGALLGEAAACAISSLMMHSGHASEVFFVSLAVLPPVGAAVLFNSSLRCKQPPLGNALLNFHESRFTLGIPDLQVRPVHVHAKNTKPEMQFKLNLLSVEL